MPEFEEVGKLRLLGVGQVGDTGGGRDLQFLDRRERGNGRGAVPAANDAHRLILSDQPPVRALQLGGDATRIGDNDLNPAAVEKPTRGVDLLSGDLGAEKGTLPAKGRAGMRPHHAELDRLLGGSGLDGCHDEGDG